MTKPRSTRDPIWEEDWNWNEETGDVEVHYDVPGPHYGIVGHSDVDSTGKMFAAAPDMARLLVRFGARSYCLGCGVRRDMPCKSSCALDAALRKAGVR